MHGLGEINKIDFFFKKGGYFHQNLLENEINLKKKTKKQTKQTKKPKQKTEERKLRKKFP